MKERIPTATQRAVLERMEAGSILHTMTGIDPCSFLSGDQKTVRWDTLLIMTNAGWIENFQTPEKLWRGAMYRITAAGRLALKSGAR